MTEWDLPVTPGGLVLRIREWGSAAPDRLPTVVLHGFLEQSAAWDEVAELLPGRIVAPDHRGHGLSGHVAAGSYYWFWDYVADLDALITHLGAPVDLVGHSMGGTIACLYAGSRPDRVRRLALIEGLGPPDNVGEAVERARAFLDQRHDPPRHKAMRTVEVAAERMRRFNPNIPAHVATRLAARALRPVLPGDPQVDDPDRGGLTWTWDAKHRGRSPYPFQTALFTRFLREITAPVLAIDGGDSPFRLDDDAARLSSLRDVRTAVIPGAGHLVHHDQPAVLAGALREFFGSPEP